MSDNLTNAQCLCEQVATIAGARPDVYPTSREWVQSAMVEAGGLIDKHLTMNGMDHPDLEAIKEAGTPILAWCDDNADTVLTPEDKTGRTLTLFAAHAEGMATAGRGWRVVEWGGGFDDSTYEHPDGASLGDWWFQSGSDHEVVAFPVKWTHLPNGGADLVPAYPDRYA